MEMHVGRQRRAEIDKFTSSNQLSHPIQPRNWSSFAMSNGKRDYIDDAEEERNASERDGAQTSVQNKEGKPASSDRRLEEQEEGEGKPTGGKSLIPLRRSNLTS